MGSILGTAAPFDPMNEMYEFFAFDEALENGLSVDALIEEQEVQVRPNLETRVNQFGLQLNNVIDRDEHEREQLVEEARGLVPTEAQIYCDQLTQRVNDLKQVASKQEKGFNLAQETIREQREQCAALTPSIEKMRALIRRQQENQAHFQGQLYSAGAGFCQYIANSSSTKQK